MQSPMVEGMLKTSNVPPQYIGERGQGNMNTWSSNLTTFYPELYFRAEINLRDLSLVPHRYCEYQYQSGNHRPANQVQPSPNIKNLLQSLAPIRHALPQMPRLQNPSFFRDFDLKNLKRLEEKDKKEMSESYNPSRASSAVGSEQGQLPWLLWLHQVPWLPCGYSSYRVVTVVTRVTLWLQQLPWSFVVI